MRREFVENLVYYQICDGGQDTGAGIEDGPGVRGAKFRADVGVIIR